MGDSGSQLQPHLFFFFFFFFFFSIFPVQHVLLRLPFRPYLTLYISIPSLIDIDCLPFSTCPPRKHAQKANEGRNHNVYIFILSSAPFNRLVILTHRFRAGKKEKRPRTRAPRNQRLSHCTTASRSSTCRWISACTSTSTLVYGGRVWPRSMMVNRPDTLVMTPRVLSRATSSLVCKVSCPPVGPADTLHSQWRCLAFPVPCVKKWLCCLQAGISLARFWPTNPIWTFFRVPSAGVWGI